MPLLKGKKKQQKEQKGVILYSDTLCTSPPIDKEVQQIH